MSKAEVSYVQYFVPSDGDSEDHPNVFVVRKAPKVLTVADIVSSFPLPGEYLFRAKMPFGKTHGALRWWCPCVFPCVTFPCGALLSLSFFW